MQLNGLFTPGPRRPGTRRQSPPSTQILRIMKITAVFLFITFMEVGAEGHAQSVTWSGKNVPIKEVLSEFQRQTGYNFFYNYDLLAEIPKVSLDIRNKPLKQVLNEMVSGKPYKITVVGKTVVIMQRAREGQPISPVVGLQPGPDLLIRGRVFNTKEPPDPLPGVIIRVKHEQGGTTTDATGDFSLSTRKGDTLVFSYTGYKTREYVVKKNNGNLSIALSLNISALNQVVVTGYSTEQLQHLASAVSTVNLQASLEGKPVTQLSQALQGGVTGLTVQQSSGMPGGPDEASIKIRGISTIGNTNPLVLLDGVPADINNVDPATVASITVLKDAAAAAIYGSRGANGVIVITTKRGVPGQVSIEYQGYGGIQQPTYLPKFVGAVKYMQMVNEAYANIGGNPAYSQQYIDSTRLGKDPLSYPNTDWGKLVMKTMPFIQNHTLSVTGGNSEARFAVTGSYFTQDGLIKSTRASRFSLRANTSVTLSHNLSMYLDLDVIRKELTQPIERYIKGNGQGPGYIFYELYRIPPTVVAKYPVRPDGLISYGDFGDMENPLAELERGGYSQGKDDYINVNFQPQWEILPSLKLKGQYLFNVESYGSIQNRDAYNFVDYYTNALVFTYPELKSSSVSRSTYEYLSTTLNYDKTLGKSFVNGIAGTSREINNPNNYKQITLASYFAKINYVYDNRYLLEASYRADGSSLFGDDHKWGTFPSVAVGWNISNEKFMAPLTFLSNWKIRSSYGLLGNNQNVGPYQYQSTVNAGNGTEVAFGNPDITWETVKMLDLGTDFGFLQHTLTVTIDWYNKITDNVLLNPPLPPSSGLGAVPVNAGKIRNRGWELSASYSTRFSKRTQLSLSAGYSYYQNKILSLEGGPYINGNSIDEVGHPIGAYYGYRSTGLLQQSDIDKGVPVLSGENAGDIKYRDINHDGVIDNNDQVIIGNPNPEGNYFVNLRLDFGNLWFQVQVNGFTNSLGVYQGRYTVPLTLAGDGGVPMDWQLNYWTPTNTNARFPRLTPNPTYNQLFSDFWAVNAAFARIRYMELGYNLNTLAKKAGLGGASIYLNAQNPFTISKMKHLDPESQGSELTYPLLKFYTLGINIKFE